MAQTAPVGSAEERQRSLVREYLSLAAAKSAARPELEMRISTDQGTWARFYAEYLQGATLLREEHSIVFLRQLPGKNNTRRVEVVLRAGQPPAKRVVEKSEVARVNINGVTTVLAQEREVAEEPGDNIIHRIRLRRRYSVVWYENWTLDMTVVLSLTAGDLPKLVEHRKRFFGDERLDPRALVDPTYNYEIEAEYKGEPAHVSHSLLQQVAKRLESGMRTGSVDPEYLLALRGVARLVNTSLEKVTSFKQLFQAPKTFDKREYVNKIHPLLASYAATDKADGERAFLAYQPAQKTWLSLTSRKVMEQSSDLPPANGAVVLDCEYVDGCFYAFDLLCVNGRSITEQHYDTRYGTLKKFVEEISSAKTDAEKEAAVKMKDLLKLKVQFNLVDAKHQAKTLRALLDPESKHNRKFAYRKDGIILTPLQGGYYNSDVYKYKPPELQSIDFLVMRAPEALLGVQEYQRRAGRDLYFLFCGIRPAEASQFGLQRLPYYRELFRELTINERDRFPIQFAPPNHPLAYLYYHDPQERNADGELVQDLHGQVAEFTYRCAGEESAGIVGQGGVAACAWRLMRTRPDKLADVRSGHAYGNSFLTAELIFRNYLDPITVDFLLAPTPVATGYFSEPKDPATVAPAKFNAFVKAQVMRQLSGLDTVVDLASGNGQDLFVYAGYRVKHLVLADRDPQALETIRSRIRELDKPQYYVYTAPPPRDYHLDTRVVEIDLLARPTYLFDDLGLPRLPPAPKAPGRKADPALGANAVVVNFALHYFLASTTTRDRLLDQIDKLLTPGGLLLFTCLDGESVFRLLSLRPTLELLENGQVKYKITREYPPQRMTAAGMAVQVKLPFAAEPYTEYLVHVGFLSQALKARGYRLRQNASFGDWLGRFEQYWPEMAHRLTDIDRQYNSLYRYLSFVKG